MDPQPTPAEQDAADAAKRREDMEARAQVLRELIQLSAGLVRLLSQQVAEHLATVARGEAKAGALPDLIIRYHRLSRSIERNLFMAKKLAEPAAPPRRPVSAAAQPAGQPPAAQPPAAQPPAPRQAATPAKPTAAPAPRSSVLHRDDPGRASAGTPAADLELADLHARLDRDLAARRAASLPFPPGTFQNPPGRAAAVRPPRTGTDPP